MPLPRKTLPILMAISLGTMALAHTGVQNPAVKARMNGMTAIAENLKTIGLMARSETAFDAATARAAAASIAQHAAEVDALFAAPEDDPKSEALPAIWEDYPRFTAIAIDMETVALTWAEGITTQPDTVAALTAIGQTCRSCHTAFRE